MNTRWERPNLIPTRLTLRTELLAMREEDLRVRQELLQVRNLEGG